MRDGWFLRQGKAVEREMSQWPEYMQRLAGGDRLVNEFKRKRHEEALKKMSDGMFSNEGRDPKRIPETLSKLKEYWERHPDLRLGQILANAGYDLNRKFDPFYVEDDHFVEWLDEQAKKQEGQEDEQTGSYDQQDREDMGAP